MPVITSTGALLYLDISDSWAKQYIEQLARAGVINNTTYFYPESNVTRAEFLKIALRGMGIKIGTGTTTDFTDVTEAWQIPLVAKAKELGIISGQTIDGKLAFRPNDTITRAEVMKMLLKAAGYKAEASTTDFTDVTEAWQIPLVAKAKELGIISGQTIDGKLIFRPNDTITRAEVTKIIVKV